MHKFKYFLALLTALATFSFGAPVVLALEQPAYGGRSSDYHPPTRNPQGSSPTGLQPTNPNTIQPAPGGINPQALIRSGGLKVLTSPDNGASTTASEQPKPHESNYSMIIWIIGGILTFAAVFYIVAKPDKKPENQAPAETPTDQPAVKSEKPKKSKKTAKSKSGKKRKAGRR